MKKTADSVEADSNAASIEMMDMDTPSTSTVSYMTFPRVASCSEENNNGGDIGSNSDNNNGGIIIGGEEVDFLVLSEHSTILPTLNEQSSSYPFFSFSPSTTLLQPSGFPA